MASAFLTSAFLRGSLGLVTLCLGCAPSGRECRECPEMVDIPAGSFTMGSPASEAGRYDNEGLQHRVTIRPFALSRTEVTRGQFAAFVAATGYSPAAGCVVLTGSQFQNNPARSWQDPGYPQTDRDPVVCVNWDDAQAYVRWLSARTDQAYRLPSEAEWEYAARAGSTTPRFWGDDPDDGCAYANAADRTARQVLPASSPVANCTDGYVYTAPAASFRANGLALNDMLGNVWEWTQDCRNDGYAGAPADGSAWQTGDCGRHMIRGGSWADEPRLVRSAARNDDPADTHGDRLGFRVARTR